MLIKLKISAPLSQLFICVALLQITASVNAQATPAAELQAVKTIPSIDVARYLGTWYEIARLDHSFERGLDKVYAEYSLREDGGLKVVNHGYDTKKQKWNEAIGKAYFVETPDVGRLKVSFFGPFYGGYNVIALDSNYQYALVAGENLSYLWILSRQKSIPDAVRKEYLDIAKGIGYKTEELIWLY